MEQEEESAETFAGKPAERPDIMANQWYTRTIIMQIYSSC